MVSRSAGKLSMAHKGQSLPMVAPALFASRQNHHYKALWPRVLQSSSFLHPGVAAASLCFFLVPVACLCDLTLWILLFLPVVVVTVMANIVSLVTPHRILR
jgi:hypothetical protein